MNTALNHIQDWPELSREAKWSASALAKKCGVSVRALERYFRGQFAECPRTWLAEQRQRRAIELLRDGSTVKEVAGQLGYKNQHHFSREFKKQTGHPPCQLLPPAQFPAKTAGMSHLDTQCRV